MIEPPADRAKRRKDATTPPVLTPTAIPGVERRRITVTSAAIARLSPGATSQTATRALRLIDTFVVDSAREQHVAQWGRAAEQDYAALALEMPEPAQGDLLDLTRGYIGRIVFLLGTIDVTVIRDIARPMRAELMQLVHRLRTALEPLRTLTSVRAEHSRRVDEASFEIEAAALGALFLAEHLATSRPELSRRFVQREMDLTRTVLEIRSGQFERDGLRDQARTFVTVIEDVVLVTLLDWLDGVATLAKARPRATPTELGELQHRLHVLIRKLEP